MQYFFHFKVKFPNIIKNENKLVSDLGWEIYPLGLYRVLTRLAKYNLPIYVTENGIADARDALRADFIKSHMAAMKKAMSDGADVRGYFYWSLLDNFEWDKGFWPRFGLAEVDYKTFKRKIRANALVLKRLFRKNKPPKPFKTGEQYRERSAMP